MDLSKITPATQADLQALDKKLTDRYELIFLNMVQQIRATLLASKISPEQFHKAFIDYKGHDKFFEELHKIDNAKPAGAQDSPVGGDKSVTEGVS